jgi:hypothetical protein
MRGGLRKVEMRKSTGGRVELIRFVHRESLTSVASGARSAEGATASCAC